MWTFLGTKLQFEGWRIRVRTDSLLNPDGRKITRDVVEHPGAVAIVARTKADEVILVRQYRHATGEELLEIPAGTREEGESPIETARRELEEETGYTANKIHQLTTFYTAPGFTNEMMFLFEATEVTPGNQKLENDEFIDVVRIRCDDVLSLIHDGRIKDAKTIVGLLMVLR